jgi:NADH dehydrogenase
MILLTGSTGLIGSVLLRRLLDSGEEVRCLVRDPRRLGPNRVRVQITLGELEDPNSLRQSVRGVKTVVHLAASIRDQQAASIEELNGLATARLLRDAERAGVERFIYFSALCATPSSRTRFFRSKSLAEQAVLDSEIETMVFAPSIVYAPGDPWLTLLSRMMYLPWMPITGDGRAPFQPIWAEDVASCVTAVLSSDWDGKRRHELAGPEVLTYEDIVELALEADGRRRPVIHLPMGLVRRGLRTLERVVGPSVFATWEEVELLEEPMTTPRGAEDARGLGVDPKPMRQVLGISEQVTPE